MSAGRWENSIFPPAESIARSVKDGARVPENEKDVREGWSAPAEAVDQESTPANQESQPTES